MTDHIALIKKIAQDLIGTCSGSNPVMEGELDELGVGTSSTASEAFDEICFLCDQCGWYCSADELNTESGESLCEDCTEENEE